MFKPIIFLILIFTSNQVVAWEQYTLPIISNISSTKHYGGNKAPLLINNNLYIAIIDDKNINVLISKDTGITWEKTSILNLHKFDNVKIINEKRLVAWGKDLEPLIYEYNNLWKEYPNSWPLKNFKIIDIKEDNSGNIAILLTTPKSNKLVEGELFIIYGNTNGWEKPTPISDPSSFVGDATFIQHNSGLQSIIWAQRNGNNWEINYKNKYPGKISWEAKRNIIPIIYAPYFQEAAIHISADKLNTNETVLVFSGWGRKKYNQLWSTSFNHVYGNILTNIEEIPTLSDMVYQPSLVNTGISEWAVAWQQKTGTDLEIFTASYNTGWGKAMNVSQDINHIDINPHISIGANHTINVSFSNRNYNAEIETYVYKVANGISQDSSLTYTDTLISNNTQNEKADILESNTKKLGCFVQKTDVYTLLFIILILLAVQLKPKTLQSK